MLNIKDLLFTVGQKITVTVLQENYNVCIRGWREGEYVVVDMPMHKGSPLSMASLAGCEVVFTREGNFIKFNCSVLVAFRHSPMFLVVSYPKTCQRKNLRKHNRYQANIPIIFVGKDGMSTPGMIRDISLEGALITHDLPLAMDAKIVVSAALKVGNLEGLVAVTRNIRNYVKNEKTQYASGIEFLNPLPKNEHVLQKIVSEIQKQAKDISLDS